MTTSKKQVEANKKNAKKGGVKTSEGKEIVKYNTLKHGLLAKEAVITVGDGAENSEEFSTLLEDLKAELSPEGTLEEMLVEKIAVAYWRLRRAYRYEVGLIREELDNATDDFYGDKDWEGKQCNKTDEEIEQQIDEAKEGVEYWKKDKKDLAKIHKNGKLLEVIYDWEDNWGWLCDKGSDFLEDYDYKIRLTATPCHFGGVRYWFICPLTKNGIYCGRRVGTLYLGSGGHYFGCRYCYDLSYESRNESRLGRFGQWGYLLKAESQYEELYKKTKRWIWRGRPTRKARKLHILGQKMSREVALSKTLLD